MADANTYLQSLPGIGPNRAASIIKAVGDDMVAVTEMLSQPEEAVIARLKKMGIPLPVARDVKAAFDRERGKGALHQQSALQSSACQHCEALALQSQLAALTAALRTSCVWWVAFAAEHSHAPRLEAP